MHNQRDRNTASSQASEILFDSGLLNRYNLDLTTVTYTQWLSFQEQYEFLHHSLVHTLTLACAQIPADTFPQYMATTSAAEFAQQFKASPNI